jgi:hypothetical protein
MLILAGLAAESANVPKGLDQTPKARQHRKERRCKPRNFRHSLRLPER